ncbi:MAG: cyclic nucleotide-binding domain-containing protein [Rhodospirillales bacterium]|jgi:putative ABC transport system ATP-binding protein|nr:cyclic nucleotide-binding domain-containing protein [Rhodospirillales bacterium]
MERTVFQFIRRYSMREQIVISLTTLISFPFLYFSLDLPKTIINGAIGGDRAAFPIEVLGFSFTQVQYLLVLCFIFLLMVFINGGFKFRINVMRGVVAERMLRRMRYLLLSRTLRFPLAQFHKTSQGELVAMVTAEVEPLGGFFGDAYALPLFQGGTFLTILAFMFIQNPWLCLTAMAMIPVQAYVIPKLQRRINAIGKQRVRHVRRLSDRIGEVVSGVAEVHAHDTSGFIRADFSKRLGDIFHLRFDLYKKKFFMKFINNFLNQITPFFFFSIGGYLVIQGNLSFGALVAALAAYKDLAGPWKELLNYYQRLADTNIKYEELTEQFRPEGMLDEEIQQARPETIEKLDGPFSAKSVSLVDDDGTKIVDQASFTLSPGSRAAIVGPGGGGKEALAQLAARLLNPTSGKIMSGDTDIATLPQAVSGSRIGYVSGDSYIFVGTLLDNLLLGLKHSPAADAETSEERQREFDESVASGNSPDNLHTNWIDYQSIGLNDEDELRKTALQLLKHLEFGEDLFKLGLRQRIDPVAQPELAAGILDARQRVREVLEAQGAEDLVRQYRSDEFNPYISVAENILFGQPVERAFSLDQLSNNEFVCGLLDEDGLTERFQNIGLEAAKVVVELFSDLPAGHQFFEQYSFVDEDGLEQLQKIVRKTDGGGIADLNEEERAELLGLPFLLNPHRHRLGLIDTDLEARILKLRQRFNEKLPESERHCICFFRETEFNTGLDIESNILFGSISFGQADAKERIETIIREIVDDLGLSNAIMEAALGMDVGIAGGRLVAAQRQKVALARTLIKQPDILIVNEALSLLEAAAQSDILKKILELLPDVTLIWVDGKVPQGIPFDPVLHMKNGRISAPEVAGADPPEEEKIEEAQDVQQLSGIAKTLAQIPLFAGLDRSRLKLLVFTSDVVTYRAKETIIHQGDPGDDAFVILRGDAKVYISREGEERYIRTCSQNDVIGDLALICDMPRTASIIAETDVEILRMKKEVFLELIGQDRHASIVIMRDLAKRLATV